MSCFKGSFKMERPLEFIGDITDNKDLWKLAVKIKEKWSVVKDGKEHLEMFIVDSKVDFLFYLIWAVIV